MALVCNTDIPDSLSTLLKKVHGIAIVNKDNLDFIHSRKGQHIILEYQYSLNIKTKPTKRRKTSNHTQKHSTSNHNDDSEDELLNLSNHKHTKPVNDIIEAWKYKGDPLTAEKIAFDHFIDIKLNKFDDLVRLNNDYLSLHEKYSRVLNDEPESVAAVYGLLKNLEKVHVAIGEVHVQLLDAKDPMEDKSILQSIKALSDDFASLKEKMPQLDIVMNNKDDDDNILEFENVASLSRKKTFKHSASTTIWDMKCVRIDDRQYIACGLSDGSITFWDLNSQTISFTLTGHKSGIYALTDYKKEGIQMLASGSYDKTIKLWNLSNRSLVTTLSGHTSHILSLSTYKNDGKVYLASGSCDETIKIWDIENNAALITTLEGHEAYVMSIKTYMFDGIPHLVSGSWDGTVKIWNLSTHILMRTLDTNHSDIRSLAVTNQNNKIIIACGLSYGAVEICDLENNSFTVLSSPSSFTVYRVQFIRQDSQLCLLTLHEYGSLKCWNVADRSIISTFDCEGGFSLLTCKIEGCPCIVTGGRGNDGQFSIWNETI